MIAYYSGNNFREFSKLSEPVLLWLLEFKLVADNFVFFQRTVEGGILILNSKNLLI